MTNADIKPTSFRAAILQALSDGAIVTIDDLQTRMNEPRRKIQDNVQHAVKENLIKRLRDDVTHLPAYQITSQGRAHLAGATPNNAKASKTSMATLADTVATWAATPAQETISAVGENAPDEGIAAKESPDVVEIAAPAPADEPATDPQRSTVAEKYLTDAGGHLVYYPSIQSAQEAAIAAACAGNITEVYALVPMGTAYPQAAAWWCPA